MQRRVSLIVNPRSGSCNPARIETMLKDAGCRVETFLLGDEVAAADSAPDVLAVAGGDGSIAPIALAARHANIPLGIIPAGTANDFARAAGVPQHQREACEVIATSQSSQPWDIGWVDDFPFLNTASIGLAIGAARRGAPLKPLLGARAYSVGAVTSGLLDHPLRCSMSVDGEHALQLSIWQLTISNTGSFGGGAQLPADITDHHLDLVYVRANISSVTDAMVNRIPFAHATLRRLPVVNGLTSRTFLPLHAMGMKFSGKHLHPFAQSRKGAQIEVSAESDLTWNIDGEIVKLNRIAMIRIEPDSFRILSAR